ncbi:MAG: extracellular solute-binding protein [Elusimicrobiota bacterium]|jgi:multiple sugar transport system substrate-binding protein
MSSNPIRLNLWVMPNAGFDTQRVMNHELALFREENPGFDVHLTVHPWHFAWDRLIAVAKHKDYRNPPDVIQIGGTWNATLAALGILSDLTDYLDDIERTDIIRPVWNYCYEPTRTKAYSLPWFLDARVLYYRNDILHKLGLRPEDIGTWKGFREACERLHNSKLGKRYFALPLAGQKEAILIHDLAPWIWGAGGSFLSSDHHSTQFNDPSALKGIDYYIRMMVDHLIPIFGRDRFSTGDFFSGQFAFQVSGVWPVNSYLNPEYPYYQPEVAKHYGISVFPAGPAGQVTFLGGSNLAIVSTSQHPHAAWKLIKFLTGMEAQVRHSRQIGMLPSRYSALEKLLAVAPPPVAEVFRHSLRVARTLPCAATLGAIERIMGRATQKLIAAVRENRYDEKLLTEAMASAARESDYILSLYE